MFDMPMNRREPEGRQLHAALQVPELGTEGHVFKETRHQNNCEYTLLAANEFDPVKFSSNTGSLANPQGWGSLSHVRWRHLSNVSG